MNNKIKNKIKLLGHTVRESLDYFLQNIVEIAPLYYFFKPIYRGMIDMSK